MATQKHNLRQGLPRVAGGQPWPPTMELLEHQLTHTAPDAGATEGAVAAEASAPHTPLIRRGLPRVAGGAPWPIHPTESGPEVRSTEEHPPAAATPHEKSPTRLQQMAPISDVDLSAPPEAAGPTALETQPLFDSEDPGILPVPLDPPIAPSGTGRQGLAITAAATATSARTADPAAPREPQASGTAAPIRRVKTAMLGVCGVIVAAALVVLVARGITTLPGVPEFLKRYPGEYHPAVPVDPGFPAWARWTHFLNFFMMVLIIRSGWQVRTQQQPPAFWTPKRGGKKISLNLWFHTSVDILWLVNGVIFVVLLFVSGHWVRIVPTSWEVFPNAASALLQYFTLDWPTENGWVNYNSLQQLMYTAVVFIAAPLAAITGVRMSEWWPQHATRLNRWYPAAVARAVHYPTMLFFVLFIIVHVVLVLSTGALRNLNHMFAGNDAINWAGFWWFVAGILVTSAVAFAARPLVIAPIAALFGKVSNR